MRLITLAIHTYDHALALRHRLAAEGIEATLQNVNLEKPEVASGVRVRIKESDLPLALRIVEHPEMFSDAAESTLSDRRHRILVPFDFSDPACKAVSFALQMADRRKADIDFIHSYIDKRFSGHRSLADRLTFDPLDNDDSERQLAMANSRMADFASKIREDMRQGIVPPVKFSVNVEEGVPEDAIVGFANNTSPYVVVMGTRPASQKEDDLIGSVTASVLDASRYPVLSIPANCDIQRCLDPKKVLFFSNLEQEDIVAMDALYRFYPGANLNVTIVHVPQRGLFADPSTNKSAMALTDYCARAFSQFTFRSVPLSPKNVAQQLRDEQLLNQFDLVVVPNRRKSAFTRLFNPGLTYKILFQADIPMLVIPV